MWLLLPLVAGSNEGHSTKVCFYNTTATMQFQCGNSSLARLPTTGANSIEALCGSLTSVDPTSHLQYSPCTSPVAAVRSSCCCLSQRVYP